MRVLIADDSILIRNVITEMLATDKSITIVGIAANGADAVERALALEPDLVIMDIDMPIMNGLEATERIVAKAPIPILVFTHNTDPRLPFEALRLGALDFALKPDFGALNDPSYVGTFLARLKAIAARRERRAAPAGPAKPAPAAPRAEAAAPRERAAAPAPPPAAEPPSASIVVVGASTGGPQAVAAFLSALPRPFPLPVALVQHIETGFDAGYAAWLATESGHRVVLATHGEALKPGIVYVGPTDRHFLVTRGGATLDDGPKVQNQKPAVDLLFKSAAESLGAAVLAVLLTGMGADGAEGCVAVRAHGGFTIAQDEASSLIFGMPRAAIARGAASIVLPLDRIGPFVAAAAEKSS